MRNGIVQNDSTKMLRIISRESFVAGSRWRVYGLNTRVIKHLFHPYIEYRSLVAFFFFLLNKILKLSASICKSKDFQLRYKKPRRILIF